MSIPDNDTYRDYRVLIACERSGLRRLPVSNREPTRCVRCGRDDILDDATQLCMPCHIITAAERKRTCRA